MEMSFPCSHVGFNICACINRYHVVIQNGLEYDDFGQSDTEFTFLQMGNIRTWFQMVLCTFSRCLELILHDALYWTFIILHRQRDNINITEDNKYKIYSDERGNTKLVIKNVTEADMGLYYCVAENREGKQKTAATLRVVGKSNDKIPYIRHWSIAKLIVLQWKFILF